MNKVTMKIKSCQ